MDINLTKKLEALLFVYGEPTSVSKFAEVLGAGEQEISEALLVLKEELVRRGSGLDLVVSGDKAMLSTSPEVGETVKAAIKNELEAELTPASLETLSIIAYLGPVTRAVIEFIRGVNSSFILRSLMVRGLIEKDADSKTPAYKVTFDFLRHMGVSSAEELPDYGKYREVVNKYMQTTEEENVES